MAKAEKTVLKVPLTQDEYLAIHRRHRLELVALRVRADPPLTVWGLPDGTTVCASGKDPKGPGWLFMLDDGYVWYDDDPNTPAMGQPPC